MSWARAVRPGKQQTRTSVFATITIADLLRVAGRPQLDARGWFACPMHDDHTPSAHVVPASNGRGWRCFACLANGGIADLAVALRIGHDHASAARELERRFGRR